MDESNVVISLAEYKCKKESETTESLPARVHLDVDEHGKLSFQIHASGKSQIEVLMSATLLAHSTLFRKYMEVYGTQCESGA